MPKRAVEKAWKIRIVRFAGGGTLNLVNRLILAFVFSSLGLAVWLNYIIVHLCTLCFAFFYHSKVTFNSRATMIGFRRFTLSVLALRIADYVFVVMTNQIQSVKTAVYAIPKVGGFLGDYLLYITILLSSVSIFFIRYTIFRKYTFSSDPASGASDVRETRDR